MKSNKKPPNTHFDKKISETLIEFASPLLELKPDDTPDSEIEGMLMYAVTVWNAIVLRDVKKNDHYLSEIHKKMSVIPVVASIVEKLIQRKETLFKDDYRLIGDYKIRRKNGELNLWAEARDPYTIP